VDHEIEAAFVAEPFSPHGLDSEVVFHEELVLITPPRLRRIRRPKDIGHATLIAFTTGCSYRRRLESWLGGASVVPERIMEFGSYHAIVACVAAGAGIAVVPRSVLRTVPAAKNVATHALPPQIAKARTHLVWRATEKSAALAVLLEEAKTGSR
jgi:DNA-binding transcriptional LysR family regulator